VQYSSPLSYVPPAQIQSGGILSPLQVQNGGSAFRSTPAARQAVHSPVSLSQEAHYAAQGGQITETLSS
jgi:hypothetical protein